MVLPLPVAADSGEKAVTFIDLKNYAAFFTDLRSGFPMPMSKSLAARGDAPAKTKLEVIQVIQVGSFEASYVPTVNDFSRLDSRFRLPPGTWDKLPAYRDYGFAVFKLKPGAATVHPMAFSFPRADKSSLFFPTVHIHDGRVHGTARFDHALYCQTGPEEQLALTGWVESKSPAWSFMKADQAKGLIDAERHCYLKELHGNLPNRDTLLQLF